MFFKEHLLVSGIVGHFIAAYTLFLYNRDFVSDDCKNSKFASIRFNVFRNRESPAYRRIFNNNIINTITKTSIKYKISEITALYF